jgi:hypothetical protein
MRFIRLDINNMVINTRIGKEIVPGEIASELGECGQIKQLDGSYITPEPIPQSDPNIELDVKIQAATTLEELKSALLGKNGTSKVKGETK